MQRWHRSLDPAMPHLELAFDWNLNKESTGRGRGSCHIYRCQVYGKEVIVKCQILKLINTHQCKGRHDWRPFWALGPPPEGPPKTKDVRKTSQQEISRRGHKHCPRHSPRAAKGQSFPCSESRSSEATFWDWEMLQDATKNLKKRREKVISLASGINVH